MKKSDLLEYRGLLLEVRQLRDELEELEGSLYSPKGQQFTSVPRNSSGAVSTMDAVVARHIKLENMYREELADKEARQARIESAVMGLADVGQRLVMRERYIRGLRWPAVVSKLQKAGYSERQVYRLHGFALLALEEV